MASVICQEISVVYDILSNLCILVNLSITNVNVLVTRLYGIDSITQSVDNDVYPYVNCK